MKLRVVLVSLTLVTIACASSSTIQPAKSSRSHFEGAVYGGESNVVAEDKSGSEQYRVFEQGATGFVSLQSVRETAEQRADEFCARQAGLAKTLTEHTSKPPHILGNFPRVELVFICVSKANLAAAPATFQDPTYIKLANLKKLLDDGVITKEEFEKQKAKILNQQ
jgi:hypothetical protein